jgi:hypothetical protein
LIRQGAENFDLHVKIFTHELTWHSSICIAKTGVETQWILADISLFIAKPNCPQKAVQTYWMCFYAKTKELFKSASCMLADSVLEYIWTCVIIGKLKRENTAFWRVYKSKKDK